MRLPRQPQPAIWIQREDYDAFKRLSLNDPDLPHTYDEWLKVATEQIAKSEAGGLVVDRIVVDPQQFAAFCKAGGIETNYTTLRGYVIALNRKKNG
jgi:hypothetical protein